MTRFASAACLFTALTVLAASPGEAQEKKPPVSPKSALAKKVTINLEQAAFGDFLSKAALDTGVKFVVDGAGFKEAGIADVLALRIDKIAVKNSPLSKVLSDTLIKVEATYKVEKDYIFITPLKK